MISLLKESIKNEVKGKQQVLHLKQFCRCCTLPLYGVSACMEHSQIDPSCNISNTHTTVNKISLVHYEMYCYIPESSKIKTRKYSNALCNHVDKRG